MNDTNIKTKRAIFGGGCFRCTEAVFKGLDGGISVMPGCSGGAPAVKPPIRRMKMCPADEADTRKR